MLTRFSVSLNRSGLVISTPGSRHFLPLVVAFVWGDRLNRINPGFALLHDWREDARGGYFGQATTAFLRGGASAFKPSRRVVRSFFGARVIEEGRVYAA